MWRENTALERLRVSESHHGGRVVIQRILFLRLLLADSMSGEGRSVDSCVIEGASRDQQRKQRTSISVCCFTSLLRGG